MTDPRMTPTNDAPVTVEPVADLMEMLTVGTTTGAFDHTPDEIGLHVMENAPAILAALASAPAGDEVEETADLMADAHLGSHYDDLDSIGRSAWHHFRAGVLAALARPRAAVGEREAHMQRVLEGCRATFEHIAGRGGAFSAVARADIEAIDLALQSPPAKE